MKPRCNCRRGLPPRGWGYRPKPPCPIHPPEPHKAPHPPKGAGAMSDLSAAIREYLTDETDVTRPSFHATAITHHLAARIVQARAGEGALREACERLADRWERENRRPSNASDQVQAGIWSATKADTAELRAVLRAALTTADPS